MTCICCEVWYRSGEQEVERVSSECDNLVKMNHTVDVSSVVWFVLACLMFGMFWSARMGCTTILAAGINIYPSVFRFSLRFYLQASSIYQ